ncbi:hypothetical protein H6P81_016507 [Aristolochia fimbriata]|uniref:Uncharacterized protein n=1 Tax=Aristolochia fimbriata TaxID=158543 RepID=A0AAV7ECB2_ARIFI|nr:hypothetical protein H6P81_016507 [Aristolochia fimbriata]
MILELRTPRVDEKADGQSATSQVPQERIGSLELPREITTYRENESLAVKEERAKETLRITIPTERYFDSHREIFRFPPREISIPTERDFDSTEKVWSFFSSDSKWGEESGGDSVRGVDRGCREGDLGGESGEEVGSGSGEGSWEGSP